MERTLLEVIEAYKDRCDRMSRNLVDYLIPVNTPVLVSYGGVYRSYPPGIKWIPGIVVGHFGDRIVDTKVRVNAMAWDENRRYHQCKLHYNPPADPNLEIVVKVSGSCVQVDRARLCMLSDYPHHPDFVGNAAGSRFLHDKLCEYNRSRTKKRIA